MRGEGGETSGTTIRGGKRLSARPSVMRVASALRAGLIACVVALTAFAAASPAAAQYRLAPGDRLRVTVLGAAELSGEAEIDVDGKARLPVFGPVPAAGLEIDAMQQALRDRASGRVFKRIAPDGGAIFIAIEPDDIYADVAAYRPVYVTGAVGRGGGVVPFRPGMSVRVALASAGAAGEQAIGGNPRLAVPRLIGEQRALSNEIGRLVVELWRLEAELAETVDPPSPSSEGVPVRAQTFDAFVAAERARLAAARAALAERRAFFKAAIEQADERIEILQSQRKNQISAAELDQDEQQRVETLFERGVVPIARLLDTRRAQLLSSTRLLDTDNNLERVRLERVKFEGDAKIFEEERKRNLLDAMALIRARTEAASARLAAAREELVVNGQAIVETDAQRDAASIITLFRGSETLTDISPDFPVEPGDVIAVAIETFDPVPVVQ